MSSFVRRSLLLVLTQVACIAIGLWLEHRHVLKLLQAGGVHVDAAVESNLAFAAVVAGTWIAIVLAIATWVYAGRMYEQERQQQGRAMADTLRQAQSLVRTRDAVIFGLAKLADSRDEETGEHLDRICAYAVTLATELRKHPKFADQITPAFVQILSTSAALHDIGKVGIEDSILRKPGPLTPREYERIQDHTRIGARCLHEMEQRLGSSNFLHIARQIAESHHEHWDGNGYPSRIAGADIPLAARIVAICDVYDALSSRRVYKEPLPHDRCVEMIAQQRARQFDPDMIEAWLTIAWKFRDIARNYGVDLPRVPRPGAEPPSAPGPSGLFIEDPATAAAQSTSALSTSIQGVENAVRL